MIKNWILDLETQQYEEIRRCSQTPKEALYNYHQLQDYQKSIELIKYQLKPNTEAKWILFVTFRLGEEVLMLSHYCQQLPAFLVEEIYEVIQRHSFQIQNNKHVMNQFLNQNGFKNYDQIVKEIFQQEMQYLLEEGDSFKSQDRFKDYFFLFQSTLNRILKVQNVVSLAHKDTKDLLFDFLNIENSLKDLNGDYLTLFFLNKKCQTRQFETDKRFIETLIPFYQKKVEYHLQLLARYLDEFLTLNKDKTITSSEVNEDFQAVIIHLTNLKEFFAEIISEYNTKETTLEILES